MALQHFDGFEGYSGSTMSGWITSGSGGVASVIQSGTGRSGTNYFTMVRTGSAADYVYRGSADITQPSGYAGFGFLRDTGGQGVATFFNVLQSGNSQLTLRVNTDLSISLLCGATVLATSAASVVPAPVNWYFIDFTWTISATVGAARVRVDGVPVIQVSNVNTQSTNTSPGVWTRVAFQNICATGSVALSWDDFYFGDTAGPAPYNTVLGDVRVLPLKPTSDVSKAFVPSTGANNFANVAKNTHTATPNNASDVVGAIDRFTLGDLPYTPSAIHAVRVMHASKKSDVAARTGRNKLWSGATLADGVPYSALTTDAFYGDTYLTNPATGTPWTPTAVNALEIGYEVVS